MIKVSITDDHYVVLKGIESLLKDEKTHSRYFYSREW